MVRPGRVLSYVASLLAFTSHVCAKCQCGYTVNSTNDLSYAVFTEMFETDFLHIYDLHPGDPPPLRTKGIGWRAQGYETSPKASRGPFGKRFQVDNVKINPINNTQVYGGQGMNGGDPGLQLVVRQDISNSLGMRYVSSAEIAAEDRNDMHYGSFRVAMKMSGVNGTCGAFFLYHSDSQEIDIELLSKQFAPDFGRVNLVVQSPASVSAGYDARNTSDFFVQPVSFDPGSGYHEYRFDWLPDSITFYIDGIWQHQMTKNIPTGPGHLLLNHWSNGDPGWSGGPPAKNAVMTVSYVKAYFNTTNTNRALEFAENCREYVSHSAGIKESCSIPDQRQPPQASGPNSAETGETYFFSKVPGEWDGQVVFDPTKPRSGSIASRASDLLMVCVGMAISLVGFL